ncbi:MAG TPA: TPM domain-containing protein [Lutibacter sp.]|nr:TPM domain-containing protein [Lutibacter sp.]
MNHVESFLTAQQEKAVIQAIQKAENNTSGEIRVHIENKTEKPTLERAKEVFLYLKMDQTQQRNGILLYVGVTSKQFAILGDEGINRLISNNFWEEEKKLVLHHFSKNEYKVGLVKAIERIGEKLNKFFPYKKEDKNELSDKISKG